MVRVMVLLLFMNTWVPTCDSPSSYTQSSHDSYYHHPYLKGKVTDAATARPITGTSLLLTSEKYDNWSIGQSTDMAGEYYFDNLGSGDWTLIAAKNGYRPETLSVSTCTDSVIVRNISLTRDGR